ncbi:hypothetical protein COOONC_02433 [Cooperia oncophora]
MPTELPYHKGNDSSRRNITTRVVNSVRVCTQRFSSMILEELAALILILAVASFQNFPLGIVLGLILLTHLVVAHRDFLYRGLLTMNRDISGLFLILGLRFDFWKRLRENRGLQEIFLEVVKKNGQKTAMIDIETGRTFTFETFNKECNRYANFFQGQNFRAGDVVALFMENTVDFIAAWMGLAKIGVATAWINSNLKREPLAHCIRMSRAKAIITTPLLQPALHEAIADKLLDCDDLALYVIGQPENNSRFVPLTSKLKDQQTAEPRQLDVVDFRSGFEKVFFSF